jgi:hypothetical protein
VLSVAPESCITCGSFSECAEGNLRAKARIQGRCRDRTCCQGHLEIKAAAEAAIEVLRPAVEVFEAAVEVSRLSDWRG